MLRSVGVIGLAVRDARRAWHSSSVSGGSSGYFRDKRHRTRLRANNLVSQVYFCKLAVIIHSAKGNPREVAETEKWM